MGTHLLCEVKQFYRFGMPEAYERLKVTALNLLHPTASPFLKNAFLILRQPRWGEGGVRGRQYGQ